MYYAIILLAVLMPICTITAFIIGYNVNAQKKIFVRKPKRKATPEEELLARIDKAHI